MAKAITRQVCRAVSIYTVRKDRFHAHLRNEQKVGPSSKLVRQTTKHVCADSAAAVRGDRPNSSVLPSHTKTHIYADADIHQLRITRAKPHILDDLRHGELQPVPSHRIGPEDKGHGVELPVGEDVPQGAPGEALLAPIVILGLGGLLDLQTQLAVPSFVGRQPSIGSFGRVDQDDQDEKAEDGGDDAFDDEDPSV